MFVWLSANLINIVLVAVIAVITGLLIRGMIRDKKAGKSSCGGSCASCGACGGCSSCGGSCACSTASAPRTHSETSGLF